MTPRPEPRHRSERLQQLHDLCPEGSRIADVGCDHALLPIALMTSGRASHAIAADLRPGPLEFARRNIDHANLAHAIEVRLGDGLEPISPDDRIDLVYIAGMGTRSILDILCATNGERKDGLDALGITHLVAQSPQDLSPLRAYIHRELEREVVDEIILHEDEQLYHTLVVRLDRMAPRAWSALDDADRIIGAPLILKHGEERALALYLDRKIERVTIRLEGLRRAKSPDNARIAEVERTLATLERISAPFLS